MLVSFTNKDTDLMTSAHSQQRGFLGQLFSWKHDYASSCERARPGTSANNIPADPGVTIRTAGLSRCFNTPSRNRRPPSLPNLPVNLWQAAIVKATNSRGEKHLPRHQLIFSCAATSSSSSSSSVYYRKRVQISSVKGTLC